MKNINQTAVQESKSEVSESKPELAEITKTDNTKDDYLTDTKFYKSFYGKISNDDNVNISISGKTETSNASTTVEQIQKQGQNIYVSMNMLGMNIKTINKDGYTYGINDNAKKYSKTKTETSGEVSDITDNMTSTIGELKSIEFVENGMSDEKDTTDYEEYKSEDSIMKVYFDGDNIKYIDISTETTEISNESSQGSQTQRLNVSITDQIDESLFEIPSDYEEVDATELYSDIFGQYDR